MSLLKRIESQLKNSRTALSTKAFHRRNQARSLQRLKHIEPIYGKLTEENKKLCDTYATSVLGNKAFAASLYVYTVMAGEFKEGWIPEDFYEFFVLPKLKGEYGSAVNLKSFSKKILGTNLLPDIAYYINGLFLDAEYKTISPESIASILFENNERVIYKTDHSGSGRGVHIFEKTNFELTKIMRLGNGVFQSYVQQHDSFSEIFPHAATTLRVTSVTKNDGEVAIRGCILRFGTSNDKHVMAHSQVSIPIDLKNGKFNDFGYFFDLSRTLYHPTSNVTFSGKTVPFFTECISAIKILHQNIPFVRCIGWDITIDKNGNIVLLECNGRLNGIKLSEPIQGPCFSDLGWESLAKQC